MLFSKCCWSILQIKSKSRRRNPIKNNSPDKPNTGYKVGNQINYMTAEQLKQYDFILLLDKSGSMSTKDCAGGKSRWDSAQETTIALARKCVEFDSNGITVVPFAGKFKKYENVDGGDELIQKIFSENEPSGGTNTAAAVKDVIDEYIATKGTPECKPIIIICVTDGLPDDEPALVNTIVAATKQIAAREEIGLLFVQIGKDTHAHAFLKRLDDNMTSEGAALDIVSAITMDDLEDITLTDAIIQSLTA